MGGTVLGQYVHATKPFLGRHTLVRSDNKQERSEKMSKLLGIGLAMVTVLAVGSIAFHDAGQQTPATVAVTVSAHNKARLLAPA